MRIVGENLTIVYEALDAHGYLRIRRFLKGRLLREVLVTLVDAQAGVSSAAYLYLSERSVVLFVQRLNGMRKVALELEAGDRLELVEAGNDQLQRVLEAAPHTEINLNVSATNPVAFIFLNQRYLLLHSIQPHEGQAGMSINLATVYLTGADYIQKTRHLMAVISDILAGRPPQTHLRLPGLNAAVALANTYTIAIASVVVIVVIVLVFLRTMI